MKKAFVLCFAVSSTAVLGCELIVDFDRTKILGEEVPEAGATDAPTGPDATATDTGTDAPADTGTDSAQGNDAGSDASDAAADG